MRPQQPQLTPETLLQAYSAGIFPMAETRESTDIFWVDPRRRGILPLDNFHISRSLRRRMRQAGYTATADADFNGVVTGCAEREETWINATIFGLYVSLHDMGRAHSVELWDGETLVGGVYGVTLGAAFFGESMFSRRRDASKIALAFLVDRLRLAGFVLFDTQFLTPHLATLGGIEIDRQDYHRLLGEALSMRADFSAPGAMPDVDQVLQRNAQTS